MLHEMKAPLAKQRAKNSVNTIGCLGNLAHHIQKATPYAACAYNTARGCVTLSHNWHDITGFASNACLGHHWQQRMRPKSFARFCHMLDHTYSKVLPRPSIRVQMRDPYGMWRWYEISAKPEAIIQGEIGRNFVLLIRDVEKEMIKEEEWEKLTLEAALATRGRSEFLANMSHELRTPLNAIIGFAQMMTTEILGKIENKKYKEYAENIQESGTSLLNKISDIMEMSEAESGRIQLLESFANLSDILEDVLSARHRLIQSKRIKIMQHVEHKALLIRCDRVKLTRAITHLLSNALHNSPDASEVVIRSQLINKGLVLYISDNGRGIDEEHLAVIKNGLKQPHTLFATEPNGIRLGLALAKEFLSLHQAEIDIESKLGRGTLVCVTIPTERIASKSARIKPKPATAKRYTPVMVA